MKKSILIMCLLTVLTVGGISRAYAQSGNQSASETTAGASESIVRFCSAMEKALEQLRKNPSDLEGIGKGLDQQKNDLDPKQKLTPADKALLKKTMHNLAETVVTIQMEQNPQMATMLSNLTPEQKKEALSMGMQMAFKELDTQIDACETLEDFGGIQM